MKRERVLIGIGFFIVCTVWGSTWLAIKIGLQDVPPFLGASVRFFIASAILFLILKARRLPIPFTPDARKVYLALGLLSFAIPYALVYWGEQYIESGLTSILFAAYPFWVALVSHLVLERERLDGYKLGGIIAAFLGLLLIFAGDMRMSGGNAVLAMAGILFATLCQAVSLVLIKKHGQPLSPFVMNFVGMSMGAVLLLGLALAVESSQRAQFSAQAVFSILYLAAFGSVLAFVSYHWLLKRVEALYLSLTSFINPIIAVVLGAAVLGEVLSLKIFAGASCVLVGILIANGRSLIAKRLRRSP